MAMDDFNQDGFEDLVIMSNQGILVATAADVTDRNSGVVFGPVTEFGNGALAPATDPVTGDFNNDSILDVAWLAEGKVQFATVCPGPVANTACDGKQALEVILNPRAPIAPPAIIGNSLGPVALAAGRFSSAYEGSGLIVFATEFYQPNQYSSLVSVRRRFPQ
jgi:hypothetical protein